MSALATQLQSRPSHARLYTLIGLMVLFWSANFIIGKVALREFPGLLLSGLRVTLAGVLILPVYFWRTRRNSGEPPWSWSDVPVLVYLGVFGVALNQMFFVLGLDRTSVAHSSIFIAMTPMLVLLIAALIKQERMTWRKVLGMALALCGVAILNAFPSHRSNPNGVGPTPTGDFLILLAGLTFALFTVTGKRVSSRHGSVTVNTFAYVGGAIALSPVTLWQAKGFSFHQVSLLGWASLIYMALCPSVICYVIYYYALAYIPATRLSAFSYLQPVVATTMAVLILGEQVTLPLLAGAAVILLGVYLTERG